VTEPERALELARAELSSMRASGAYRDEHRGPEVAPTGAITTGKLFEWALIDPDLRNVRSTRRWGAPITALKHALLKLLAQYHGELIAEQTRFNVNLVGHVRRLEERIEELEHGLAEPSSRAANPPQPRG